MISLVAILGLFAGLTSVSGQNQTVALCPLYLAIQNRCPTTTSTTTTTTSTARSSTVSDGGSSTTTSTGATDACGLPTITFCPAMELFLSGGRNCDNGQTVQLSLTTLGQLLVNPTGENAGAAVGSNNVDELGSALSSVSKSIQATPTTATIGVTFIPVGQLIG